MPQPLPRAFRRQEQARDAEKIARLVVDVEPASSVGATSGGDERKLRGLPAVARGVRGAIAGSVPGEQFR